MDNTKHREEKRKWRIWKVWQKLACFCLCSHPRGEAACSLLSQCHHRGRNLTEILRSSHISHVLCWEHWLEHMAAKLQPGCSPLSAISYWETHPDGKLWLVEKLSESGFTHTKGLQSTLKAKGCQHKGFCCTFKNTTKPKNTQEHCLGTTTLLLFMNTHTGNHTEPQTNREHNNPQSSFLCNPSVNQVQQCVGTAKAKCLGSQGF